MLCDVYVYVYCVFMWQTYSYNHSLEISTMKPNSFCCFWKKCFLFFSGGKVTRSSLLDLNLRHGNRPSLALSGISPKTRSYRLIHGIHMLENMFDSNLMFVMFVFVGCWNHSVCWALDPFSVWFWHVQSGLLAVCAVASARIWRWDLRLFDQWLGPNWASGENVHFLQNSCFEQMVE